MEKLSESTKNILKDTDGLFWANKEQISQRMYEILFEKYPETKKLFKAFEKHQPNVFSAALLSHLVTLENSDEVLASFRISICRKHVQAGVKEEHYSMMAECLFEAMEEVLQEKATKEMIDAWEKWFYFMSNLLIERERDHYQGKHLLFPKDAN